MTYRKGDKVIIRRSSSGSGCSWRTAYEGRKAEVTGVWKDRDGRVRYSLDVDQGAGLWSDQWLSADSGSTAAGRLRALEKTVSDFGFHVQTEINLIMEMILNENSRQRIPAGTCKHAEAGSPTENGAYGQGGSKGISEP